VYRLMGTRSETERNWDLDLAEDVKGEVESKYGKLKRIKVEKMSAVSKRFNMSLCQYGC
jgi:RNA-binding protein 39